MPSYQHDPLTPMGQIEQLGRLAQGPSRPLKGWRRMVGGVGIALLALGGAVMVLKWVAGG